MNQAARKFESLFARPPAKLTGLVAAGWLTAVILAGVAAIRTGIPYDYAAWATLTAAAPAIASAILLFFIAQQWSRTFLVYAWIAFAAVGASLSGGFASPLAAAFALAPAFALQFGGRAGAAEAAFFALIGYLAAGALARDVPALALGPLPSSGAALSLVASGVLIAGARQASAPAAPIAPAPREATAALQRARQEAAAAIADHRRRAAELAHELRTPLNHILGFADAMRQRLFGPMHERYGEYVDLIHTSGRNLLDLVNGLLDLSRLEAGRYALETQPFDFRFIAEEAVSLMREQAKAKSINLTLEADAALPVRADARALRQILTNLLANAVKFTPQGGAVVARASLRGRDLVIEVQDSGPGIPLAERARLGAAFERGSAGAGAEGYGLGLSLVRAFAGAHGGKLTFDSAPGGGALVRVSAPVAR